MHSLQLVAQLAATLAELVMSQHVAAMLRGDADPLLLEPMLTKPHKEGKVPKEGKAILLAPSR